MSIKDEIRDVAKGWRWGRRTMTPKAALDSTPPPKIWSYPTDWAGPTPPASRAT